MRVQEQDGNDDHTHSPQESGVDWSAFPAVLLQAPQWCLASADKAPLYVDASGTLQHASSTDPRTWTTWETVQAQALYFGLGVGYMLRAGGGVTCVDMDVKDSTPQEHLDRYWAVAQMFNSYTELSRSGRGLHVWVGGEIGAGAKRDGIEVYSRERFIICTARPVLALPLVDRQYELDQFVPQMRAERASAVELVEEDEELTDAELVERASTADNADKFNALWRGEWQALRYPSQSEADLSLMSMLAFYSSSNEQCRRLFRYSALGQRDKAQLDNRYLNYTLSLIRARQAREHSADVAGIAQTATVLTQVQAEVEQERAAEQALDSGDGDDGLPWPPGLLGEVARYVYAHAPRPVKEVAIVAALGVLAGIAGKAWCIPNSGLNMYFILIGRSGIGKEAMHSGVSSIANAIARRYPSANEFFDFSDFASSPALMRACAGRPSFVNVAGEFGKKLQRMADERNRDAQLHHLRATMTNLYQKSGPGSTVGGITYSNKDKDIQSVSGVAYSLIGESTPDTFYSALTASMMEDGFLSRFTIIEYSGDRPDANAAPAFAPPEALVKELTDMCTQAHAWNARNTPQGIQADARALEMMEAFELECDAEIRGNPDEAWRQLWNRAGLKLKRIAGLLAVADNWQAPCVRAHHVEWAQLVVKKNIDMLQERMESGDVGTGDSSREQKMLAILRDYLKKGASQSYHVPGDMHRDGIVPRRFLQQRISTVSSFNDHRNGSTSALDLLLKSMMDDGYLATVDKKTLAEQYVYNGVAYRVLYLPEPKKRSRRKLS